MDLSGLKQQPQGGAGGGAPIPPGAVEVAEANFEADVLVRSGQLPVVVALWSPRSDVCLQLVDDLARLATADDGKWVLATVNVDAAPGVAQLFGIDAVPTVVALSGGKPLSSFRGPQPPDQLRGWLNSLLEATGGNGEPVQIDPVLAQARDQLDAGDFAGAQQSYQALLDADPNHAEAKGALRQIVFLQRATARRPDAVAVADAAPDDIEAAFAAADVQVLNQDVVAAFDRLIALVRRTAGDDRTAVRTRLVELFELFDPADPDVIAGRRNLANALF